MIKVIAARRSISKNNLCFVLLMFCSKLLLLSPLLVSGFSVETPGSSLSASGASASASTTTIGKTTNDNNNIINNILILDHLNINHEKGRHDWLNAFYFDYLKCAVDPRKMENYKSGKKTVWANIGAQQFHLPEGKPDAQVLDGIVTLVFPNLQSLMEEDEERLIAAQKALDGSCFQVTPIIIMNGEEGSNNNNNDNSNNAAIKQLLVVDPWGTKFRLIQGPLEMRDNRGSQPGDVSEGLAMQDLTIHTPVGCNLQGIGRFYEQILGAVIAENNNDSIKIQVGPCQTLTFLENESTTVESHVDLREETDVESPPGFPKYLGNYGPHVSMYVADLPSTYKRADALGLTYVNPRFKRRAYTLEEAVDDCMFRCLDIVDPEDIGSGPILKLEHEVRSVIKKDGSKYKSCPFDEIPEGCTCLL